MGFKDELKKEFNKQEDEKQRALDEAKLPIPDAELKVLSATMAENFKKELKNYVSKKYIQHDLGGFKKRKKVNFRYESSRYWLLSYAKTLPATAFRGGYGSVIPPCKYFSESDHDMSPTDLYCTAQHMNQLFSATKKILEEDGCNVVFQVGQTTYGHPYLRFTASIKCTENGEII